MLNLKREPDEIMNRLLNDAFDGAIECLLNFGEEYLDEFPHANKYFTWESAVARLLEIQCIHNSNGVYTFNEYHFTLIYDVLYGHCQVENDCAEEDDESRIVEGTNLRQVSFEGLVEDYFHAQYLAHIEEMFTPCTNKSSYSPKGPIVIIKKLSAEDLKFNELKEGEYAFSDCKNDVPFYTKKSTKYPDPQWGIARIKDEVIDFNSENSSPEQDRDVEVTYANLEDDDLSSEGIGYDLQEEIKVLNTDPQGKTFYVRLKQGKGEESLMKWLLSKNVTFTSAKSDPSESDKGIHFFIPSKLYWDTVDFLRRNDKNIVLIRRD